MAIINQFEACDFKIVFETLYSDMAILVFRLEDHTYHGKPVLKCGRGVLTVGLST